MNNLSGINYASNVASLDGLSIIQADAIYVDGSDIDPGSYVKKSGDTMSGTLNMGTNAVKSSHAPTVATDLTNKAYVDATVAGSGYVPYTGATSTVNLNTQAISAGNASFSGTITNAGIASGTPSFTVGVNGSNQLIKYANPTSSFTGSVSAGVLPYASSANVLADSLVSQSGSTVTINSNLIVPTNQTVDLGGAIQQTWTTISQGTFRVTGLPSVATPSQFTGTIRLQPTNSASTSCSMCWSAPDLGYYDLYGLTFGVAYGTSGTYIQVRQANTAGSASTVISQISTPMPTSATTINLTFKPNQNSSYTGTVYVHVFGSIANPFFQFSTYDVFYGTTTINDALVVNNGAQITGGGLSNTGTLTNTGNITNSGTLTTAGIVDNGSLTVNQTQAIPTFPITGQLPAQVNVVTGSQNLRIGTYYTGGVGSYSILQSTDYYSGVEHGTALLLNPLGGYVGVGTTSPTQLLHIKGSGGASSTTTLLVENGANANTGYGAQLSFQNNGIGLGSIMCLRENNSANYNAGMALSSANDGTITERMRITSQGNVGIGTTAPTSRLSIEQTLLASAISGTWSNIGVTMPCQFTISSPNGIHNTYIGSYFGGGVTEASVIQSSANYSSSDHGANLLLNPNGGNVGVGIVSNPDAPLTVVAQYTGTSAKFYGSGGFDHTNIVRIQNQASQYGRNQLVLTGRYENGNDAWSFNGARNCIQFWTQSSLNSAQTQRYTIQNYGDNLGILSASLGDTPVQEWTTNGNVAINKNLSVNSQPYCMLYGASIGGVNYTAGTIVFYGGALLVGQSAGMTNTTGNGWDATNGRFYAPLYGRYQINISFYWNSFVAGTRFALQHYNASNSILATRYCALSGAGYPGDTTSNYSMVIYMSAGDYVRVVCASGTSGQLYFSGYDHTHASFTMIV